MTQWLITYLLRGAEEACWAHNPKVLGLKPSGANIVPAKGYRVRVAQWATLLLCDLSKKSRLR